MANSYKLFEGGAAHADALCLGNATDKILTLSIGTVAAAGNNQGSAGALTSKVVQTVTAGDDTKGIILPAGVAGQIMFLCNTVTDKFVPCYPPSGGTVNGGAANAAWNIPNGQMAIAVCSAANTWHLSCEVGA